MMWNNIIAFFKTDFAQFTIWFAIVFIIFFLVTKTPKWLKEKKAQKKPKKKTTEQPSSDKKKRSPLSGDVVRYACVALLIVLGLWGIKYILNDPAIKNSKGIVRITAEKVTGTFGSTPEPTPPFKYKPPKHTEEPVKIKIDTVVQEIEPEPVPTVTDNDGLIKVPIFPGETYPIDIPIGYVIDTITTLGYCDRAFINGEWLDITIPQDPRIDENTRRIIFKSFETNNNVDTIFYRFRKRKGFL